MPATPTRRHPLRRPATAVVVVAVALAGALDASTLRQQTASAAERAPRAVRNVVQPGQVSPSPTPEASPAASPTAAASPAEATFEIYSVRDPFSQLVTPPDDGTGGGEAGATATGTAGSTTGTSTTGGSTTGGSTTGGSTTGGSTTGGSTTGGSTTGTSTTGTGATPAANPTSGPSELDPIRVALTDTFVEDGADKALVTVNGRGYEVSEGQGFASGFSLMAVDQPCVTLTYQGRQFLLCEGDEILK